MANLVRIDARARTPPSPEPECSGCASRAKALRAATEKALGGEFAEALQHVKTAFASAAADARINAIAAVHHRFARKTKP